jgi:hemin uptake protein HemP
LDDAQPALASPAREGVRHVNSHSVPPRTAYDRLVPRSGEPRQATPRSIDSQTLFRGASEIVIEHQGAQYRLRITRQGKLILNK